MPVECSTCPTATFYWRHGNRMGCLLESDSLRIVPALLLPPVQVISQPEDRTLLKHFELLSSYCLTLICKLVAQPPPMNTLAGISLFPLQSTANCVSLHVDLALTTVDSNASPVKCSDKMDARSFLRARAKRDITVPTGTPATSAISL